MTKKYKVGDTVYIKDEIETVDQLDSYRTYRGIHNGWLDNISIVDELPTAEPVKPTLPKAVAEMNEFETKITNITTDLADTLIAKNHDYGNAFHESVEDFGNVVMAIRINDKVKRLKTLLKTDQQVKDETIEDTLYDLAGYAILSLIEMNDQKALAEQSKQLDTQFPLPK